MVTGVVLFTELAGELSCCQSELVADRFCNTGFSSVCTGADRKNAVAIRKDIITVIRFFVSLPCSFFFSVHVVCWIMGDL